jgi:hypothetical protein
MKKPNASRSSLPTKNGPIPETTIRHNQREEPRATNRKWGRRRSFRKSLSDKTGNAPQLSDLGVCSHKALFPSPGLPQTPDIWLRAPKQIDRVLRKAPRSSGIRCSDSWILSGCWLLRRLMENDQIQGFRNWVPAPKARGVRVFCGQILRSEAYIKVRRSDDG